MNLISVHYIEKIVKGKRNTYGLIKNEKINLKGYIWKKNYDCPFGDKKGAYVRVKKYNKFKYDDAYFFI